ncbi:hypothetical protein [Demequina sp. NBRC 110052]|uniref:hypothetical protein n=1 Tax=Demequina sp. NBRC 110052 TaxID=1570341 RepID=UPI00190EE39A|nr:hypothetical protein [Demequina sp. NBRC 110052]
MFKPITRMWNRFYEKRPGLAQFLMFFLLSNGVTVLQLILMPMFKAAFNQTALVDVPFQIWPIGSNLDGTQYFIFDYPAGEVQADGTGGGLAYFLAVQITIAIAQVINFFAQRSITFRANNSVWKAAMWYFIAYVLITIFAAAAQGFYKVPIYNLFIDTWGMGSTGETIADVITMIINSAIAFWVFFPIFKVIFKQVPEEAEEDADAVTAPATGSPQDLSTAQGQEGAANADGNSGVRAP